MKSPSDYAQVCALEEKEMIMPIEAICNELSLHCWNIVSADDKNKVLEHSNTENFQYEP